MRIDVYVTPMQEPRGYQFVLHCPPGITVADIEESPFTFANQSQDMQLEEEQQKGRTLSEAYAILGMADEPGSLPDIEGSELFWRVVDLPLRLRDGRLDGPIPCFAHPVDFETGEGGHYLLDDAVRCAKNSVVQWLAGFTHEAVVLDGEPPWWR